MSFSNAPGTGKATRTIAQLARHLGVPVAMVAKHAETLFKLTKKEARDPDYKLTPHRCLVLRQTLQNEGLLPKAAPRAEAPPPSDVVAPDEPLSPEAVQTTPDPRFSEELMQFGDLPHPLHIHENVLERASETNALSRRVRLVLEHLAAHGRTTVVKGCQGNGNQGWRRSPLGGNNGNQYYLWWAPKGSRHAQSLSLGESDIVVRAIRHHDDHAALEGGDPSDYIAFTAESSRDTSMFESPWTAEQLAFIDSDSPVRVVVGRPGSGKTTVLWHAIETRGHQRVLYITWSRDLVQSAVEHFAAFAPIDARIDAIDYTTFLGEVRGDDVPRRTLAESHEAFVRVAEHLSAKTLGPWAGRLIELHAEIRARLLGRALAHTPSCVEQGGVLRLSDDIYLSERGTPLSAGGIGAEAAQAVLATVNALKERTTLGTLFPELAAALQALTIVRDKPLASALHDIDRIVIDEVQDLTLIETDVIVELCRALARQRGTSPWLLVAGDEGQTVRPSGFDWAALNRLLSQRVYTPRRFPLDENLRCPRRIAAVLERASERYRTVARAIRPTKQGANEGGQHVDARLLHVESHDRAEVLDMLGQLEDIDGAVIITPSHEPPSWLPEDLRDAVLTPADAKGLEYQTVCVLDPGRALTALQSSTKDSSLDEHARRTLIDQLRVALSRATETLAFIDVEASEGALHASRNLLQDCIPLEPTDLPDMLKTEEMLPEERVLARTQEARALLDARPKRAWTRALQAVRMLGDATLPNGVKAPEVRLEAHETLFTLGARLLVDGPPHGLDRSQISRIVNEILPTMALPKLQNAFTELHKFTSIATALPIDLLIATHELGETADWFRRALAGAAQRLRHGLDTAASNPANAASFTGNVEAWVSLTGYLGEAPQEARRLRCLAVETLLKANNLSAAETVHTRIAPPEPALTGRLREAQGRHIEAAEAYQKADKPDDARRNWRLAGRWEKAIALADATSDEGADLTWLQAFERLLKQRPAGHAERLTAAEKKRLQDLVDGGLRRRGKG